MTAKEAANGIELSGMATISRCLRQRGFMYDEVARRWVYELRLVTTKGN